EQTAVAPEQTAVAPEQAAVTPGQTTVDENLECPNDTDPEPHKNLNTSETELLGAASTSEHVFLQEELPGRAEDIEVTEKVSTVLNTPLDPPQVLLALRDGLCARDLRDDSSSSSDSDSSSSCVALATVLGDVEDDDEYEGFRTGKKPSPIKTVDEILPEELPPVEDLSVVLPEQAEIVPLGTVTSIIEQLVIIQSMKDTPPLKDDSVIFNSDRLAVGKVFEVFGPVSSPFYVMRFNSERDIIERDVKLKDSLFYAPSLTDYTLYILTEQLQQLKGSDASWKNDQEPPPEALDFSDDEEEQTMKRKKKKAQKRERDGDTYPRPQTSQRPLHQSRPCEQWPPHLNMTSLTTTPHPSPSTTTPTLPPTRHSPLPTTLPLLPHICPTPGLPPHTPTTPCLSLTCPLPLHLHMLAPNFPY
ncbi:hypothetical protein UPYG_G00050490, partial [Umbra pygmaea]